MPRKIIGKILIISIISAVVFYLLIVFGVTMGLSESELATTSLATADAMVNLLGNQLFGTVLVLGGVAGIITSWNAFIIGASRILFAMSEKGMVPKWFGFIHPKYKTPTNAILFLGALAFLPRCSDALPLFGSSMQGNRYYSRIFDRLDCIHEAEKNRAGFTQAV